MAATDYRALVQQARALVEGVPHRTANLANVSALVFETLDDLNWAGFYLLEQLPDGRELLVLGPFQGKPACIEIAVGAGVCGTAVAQDATQLVPDVHAFAGHITCDSASRSELVVPLHKDGRVVGVLDLDSPLPARFSADDAAGLEALARVVEEIL